MTEWSVVERFIDEMIADGRCNGAGLAVAVDGQPVFECYAGMARPELPAGPGVVWPVASISKLFTAATIMRLVEQGRLTLNLSLARVLSEFQGAPRDEITLRHLLTHTSGLPYESPQHVEHLSSRWTVDQFADEAESCELSYLPGRRQKYSDFGYLLAGRVASRVADVSFDALVAREILGPAGLNQTYFPASASENHRIAFVEGAIGEGESAMYVSEYGLGLAHPAFGVAATMPDLLRFALHFDPHSPLCIHSRAAIDVMTSDQTGSDEPGEAVTAPETTIHPWGIGFMLKGRGRSPELASPESYGHGGGTGCYLWIDPRYRVSIVFVSNRHYFGGPKDFMPRLGQTLNVVLAAVTR